jgi:hypothetical protein
MLIDAKSLLGYKLDSRDGEIGKVKEFYFDDRHWAIRYLVADTGNWLTERQVLISPYALSGVVKEDRKIGVDLTKKQIEESPSLGSDEPVSRQFDEAYYGYHAFPTYWSGAYMWGYSPYIVRDRSQWKESAEPQKSWDPHLRSTRDVTGHYVHALDGELGHVSDFIIDDDTWAIRYIVIDTKNWWPGKKVLVSPRWIERVSWAESKLFITLSRQAIKDAPEYNDDSLIDRDYETGLHRHHDRPGYWVDDQTTRKNLRATFGGSH